MKPADTSRSYDTIASWWNEQQRESRAGLYYVQRAMGFVNRPGKALDVGCGTGGRIIRALQEGGFDVTGLDLSQAMIDLARVNHPGVRFIRSDIHQWAGQEPYQAIVAWDSIFHVAYAEQANIVKKLCQALARNGVLLFTAGGVDGEVMGEMHGESFYYSSLNEEEYLRVLKGAGCRCVLMERDSYPDDHVVFIAIKQ